jgi:hypothetical protein
VNYVSSANLTLKIRNSQDNKYIKIKFKVIQEARKGVKITTMWQPKNPVFFKSNAKSSLKKVRQLAKTSIFTNIVAMLEFVFD